MKTEKTRFNRKGLPIETREVTELREMRISYYSCLADAKREATDDEDIVRLTAENCRRAGLPEEPCVLRTAVQVRKMRSDQYVLSQRTASFIATTNSPTPLTDPTGSRRYICCPVNGIIDTEPTVNYRQLYAQALFELHHGARYWPDHDEEARMEAHNARFLQLSKGELLLTDFFEPKERNKDYLMTLADIEQSLRQRVSAADMPSLNELSRALSTHFQAGAVAGRRGWYMQPF